MNSRILKLILNLNKNEINFLLYFILLLITKKNIDAFNFNKRLNH